MSPNHSSTLTFTNRTGLFSSKKRIICTMVIFCLFITIVGICVYQLTYAEVGSSWTSTQVEEKRFKTQENFRLPNTLKPIHYKLNLIPYLNPTKNFSMDGDVKIHIRCDQSTDRIVLNIKNISVIKTNVQLWDVSEDEKKIVGIECQVYDLKRDLYSIFVNESLIEGRFYEIFIPYRAILNDQLVGFYRSSYIDKGTNETRWLGITQFSPTDARRAFPCFDEPAFKAEFEVSLGRLENMTTLSNMNLVKTVPFDEEDMRGWVWDHYAKSLPMSTYVVGFAVTDFAHIVSSCNSTLSSSSSLMTMSQPKFSIWARPDAINQTKYAGNIGPRILRYFEEYFGIKFPLPKQDMIGVPDHRFSAMENWGMITYRELVIFYDPDYSSDSDKRRIADVVSHELGHQWFGNLVTPAWWSDLWLKEGFASYVQYLGVNYVEPDWKMLDLFVLNEVQKVFQLDALNNSHPISIPVNHPDEINRIFDDISYSKGCSIIRMMDHFLTSKTFKQGVTNYLNKWKFNNTEQNDLWESLTQVAHQDGTLDPNLTVGQIMDTWTLQKGFPVIHVKRNYETGCVCFLQSKFSLTNETTTTEEYRWYIPISYTTPEFNSDFTLTVPQFWILPNETSVKKNLTGFLDESDWFIVNIQTTGYYRVNYDTQNWILITTQLQLEPEEIHTVNRAQLIDDVMTLSRASLLTYDLALNLTLYLPNTNEMEYLPWQSYFNNLKHLSYMLQNCPAYSNFKEYVLSQLISEYNRLGFLEREFDSVLEKSHRVHILKWACNIGHIDCIQNSVDLFANWMSNRSKKFQNIIPVNLRSIVYCTAIRNGSTEEWEFAKNKYLQVNVASEKDRILTALACSQNETILTSYLNAAVTPNTFVRKQDSRNVLQRIASSSDIGKRLTFQFLQKEWPRIRLYFGAGLSIAKVINGAIAVRLKSESDLKDIENFKMKYSGEFGFGERAVDEAIEIVRTNVHWMKNSYQTVANWLKKTRFTGTEEFVNSS